MMAAVAARELRDGEVVFVGIGLPNLACNLARATHAPNLVLIYESGAVGASPSRLPVSIGDPALVTGSLMVCGMADVFQLFLQNGRIEVGFLGGAQVDRYGNINTTVIGSYERPAVRLPGSGGAAEIAVHARRTLIVAKLNPRAFPEQVDFVTSPGQGRGGRGRRELGMPGAGPVKVITDKGVLEADATTGEMVLAALYPGVTADDVQAGVGCPEAVAYGVMRDALEGAIATRVCRHELWNVGHTGNGAIAIITALTSLQPVGTEVARRQTLARWRAIPPYLASEEENQRTGLRLGFSAPRGNVRISVTQLDSLLGTPLERSPLLDPARRDTTPAFRVELERVLTTDVLPALRGYRDFLERDYLPRARSAIGVSANPDGAACYRASIRATTGFDLSPDAVRRLGIATVAALEAEMRVIARRSFRTREVGARA